MDIEVLTALPPWDWPANTAELFLSVLCDVEAAPGDRLLAAKHSGSMVVVNEALVEALSTVVANHDESNDMRISAVIALGPVLEEVSFEGYENLEFSEAEELPISESTYKRIVGLLRRLYMDAGVPKEVRRRILEAAVRAPQDWHQAAVRAAWVSDDQEWKLTAIFCMRFISGFDEEIIDALKYDTEELLYQAIWAAGNWELKPAWDRLSVLVTDPDTEKYLRLAAIDAVVCIRPEKAVRILIDLQNYEDEDIVEAVEEAITMAEGMADLEQDLGDYDIDIDDIF